MELYSYPKSGSIEQVYEEGQYKPPASSPHVAVSAEYMYDEGECDDQEAGSSLTVVPTVKVDKKGKQAINYEDEEELYDAVSVAQPTSHLNDSTPQPAPGKKGPTYTEIKPISRYNGWKYPFRI